MQARFMVMAHDGALNVEHLPVGRHDFPHERRHAVADRQSNFQPVHAAASTGAATGAGWVRSWRLAM